MLCRAAKPDWPILPAEFLYHLSVRQHGLVPAVALHLDVAPVPDEVMEGPNLAGAHPASVERMGNGTQAPTHYARLSPWLTRASPIQ